MSSASELRPRVTPGSSSNSAVPASAFRWDLGAWFGTQFGATLWLAVLAGFCFATGVPGGWGSLGGFLFLNALGFALWRSRARVSAYMALQALLAALCVVSSAVLVSTHWRGDASGLGDPSRATMIVALAVPPALMLCFFLRERAVRRARVHGSRNAP